jgi:histidine triad (HIT) family protein
MPLPSCPFCAIVAGQTAAHVLVDEPNAVAFLDARPVFPGHALVVPRVHVETLVDLPAGAVGPFFQTVQRVARAVEAGLAADGTFVAMNNKISQSVPHLHVHVVPRKKKDGLRGFFWPRVKYASVEDATRTAAAIRAALLVACLALASACSAPKGSLVLAIGTDMQTPKDIDVVSVFVSEGTVVKYDYLAHVLPEGTVTLPATLALVEPDDPTTQIQIRIIGFRQKTARVLRDIQTAVPHQRTGLLRVPLDFIDDGSGIGTIPDPYFPSATGGVAEGLSTFDPTVIASKCDPMKLCQVPGASCMTTVDGACASAVVDGDTLPAYEPQAVFGGDGGVLASGAPESCFDVETCFASVTLMTSITSTACFFPFPSGASPDTLNVGLVTPSTGACLGPGECYVPLPEDPDEGWALQGSTVQLAPGVCSQLGNGVTIVVSAGTCPTETLSQPICEPTGADAATSAPEAASSNDGELDDAD